VQARTGTALLVITGIFVLGAVSASGHSGRPAGSVTGSDPAGDVTAPGLTPAERAAIDLVSVRATGREGLGVVVTATFKGNFTGLIGSGHLKDAAAVLVLKGKTAGSSAGVVSLGAGGEGTVLRHTRSTKVGAVRNGRQVTFFVAGPGYGSVASVGVEVLVNPPALGVRTTAGRALDAPPHIADGNWGKVLEQKPDDAGAVIDDAPLILTTSELRDLLASVGKAMTRVQITEFSVGPSPVLLAQYDSLYAFSLDVRRLLAQGGPSPLSGTVTNEPDGIVVLTRNTGQGLYDAIRIGLGAGVHHTGARLLGALAGRCGPGIGPSDVLCTFNSPLGPGASASVKITTDQPYPPESPVDLFARPAGEAVFAGPFVVGGPAAACECLDLSAHVGIAHGNVVNPRGPVHLSLIMNWTMSCSGGSGACAGQITVVPSGDLKVTSPAGATAACAGKAGCPDTSTGRFVVRMTSAQDLHKENHNVPIAVKIFCKSGATLVHVRTAELLLHFGAHGLLDAKHSDLKA
jgi:hypothetical protein